MWGSHLRMYDRRVRCAVPFLLCHIILWFPHLNETGRDEKVRSVHPPGRYILIDVTLKGPLSYHLLELFWETQLVVLLLYKFWKPRMQTARLLWPVKSIAHFPGPADPNLQTCYRKLLGGGFACMTKKQISDENVELMMDEKIHRVCWEVSLRPLSYLPETRAVVPKQISTHRAVSLGGRSPSRRYTLRAGPPTSENQWAARAGCSKTNEKHTMLNARAETNSHFVPRVAVPTSESMISFASMTPRVLRVTTATAASIRM